MAKKAAKAAAVAPVALSKRPPERVPERAPERPPLRPAPPAATRNVKLPIEAEPEYGEGDEHRQFPRARITVPFVLSIGGANDRRFGATLGSVNLSVSGAFLSSSFFLPVGTRLHVSFKLDEAEPAIEADAEIIRVEHPDPRSGQGREGMAIKFVEFFAQTEVTLAKLFLGERLRSFVGEYLHSARAMSLKSESDRVVDALAAWELQKVTHTDSNIWKLN
jgi:hypothetical protein